jgi:hypothetical protein
MIKMENKRRYYVGCEGCRELILIGFDRKIGDYNREIQAFKQDMGSR